MSFSNNSKDKFLGIFRHQIFIPLAALLALILFNLIADPSRLARTATETRFFPAT